MYHMPHLYSIPFTLLPCHSNPFIHGPPFPPPFLPLICPALPLFLPLLYLIHVLIPTLFHLLLPIIQYLVFPLISLLPILVCLVILIIWTLILTILLPLPLLLFMILNMLFPLFICVTPPLFPYKLDYVALKSTSFLNYCKNKTIIIIFPHSTMYIKYNTIKLSNSIMLSCLILKFGCLKQMYLQNQTVEIQF